jgi:hypothetical protein
MNGVCRVTIKPARHHAALQSDFNVVLGEPTPLNNRARKTGVRAYMVARRANNPHNDGDPMAFKPNYGRDRAERQRSARARTEDKQRKREEKAALRKAERDAAEAPADDKQTSEET